jgi:hypothetical protein
MCRRFAAPVGDVLGCPQRVILDQTIFDKEVLGDAWTPVGDCAHPTELKAVRWWRAEVHKSPHVEQSDVICTLRGNPYIEKLGSVNTWPSTGLHLVDAGRDVNHHIRPSRRNASLGDAHEVVQPTVAIVIGLEPGMRTRADGSEKQLEPT